MNLKKRIFIFILTQNINNFNTSPSLNTSSSLKRVNDLIVFGIIRIISEDLNKNEGI